MKHLLPTVLVFLSACLSPGDSPQDSAATVAQAWDAPEYSGEACPLIVDGYNTGFDSDDQDRAMEVVLPDDPEGAPLLFTWHWLGGSAQSIVDGLDYDRLASNEGVIIVSPESDGSSYEWHSYERPGNNPDLVFFDDVIACLHEQFSIDLGRIYTTGMSAGGIWSSYLITHRSDRLAAAAPLSGGVNTVSYATPESPIPVMLTWGGPEDTYSSYSFHTANLEFSESLRGDGHFVVECEHSGGHTIPPSAAEYTWQFLADHPKGIEPEPYGDSLPSDLPSFCRLPG